MTGIGWQGTRGLNSVGNRRTEEILHKCTVVQSATDDVQMQINLVQTMKQWRDQPYKHCIDTYQWYLEIHGERQKTRQAGSKRCTTSWGRRWRQHCLILEASPHLQQAVIKRHSYHSNSGTAAITIATFTFARECHLWCLWDGTH